MKKFRLAILALPVMALGFLPIRVAADVPDCLVGTWKATNSSMASEMARVLPPGAVGIQVFGGLIWIVDPSGGFRIHADNLTFKMKISNIPMTNQINGIAYGTINTEGSSYQLNVPNFEGHAVGEFMGQTKEIPIDSSIMPDGNSSGTYNCSSDKLYLNPTGPTPTALVPTEFNRIGI